MGRTPGSRALSVRVLVAVVAGLLTSLVLAVPSADAHAYLVRSNPGDGSTVTDPPRELRLEFSEHVIREATHLEVVDGSGAKVPVSHLRLLTANAEETEQPATIVATLPRLRPDTYRASWETLSSDDLHRTSGIFVFGVNRGVSSSTVPEPLPKPEEAALRWLLLLGAALALGGALARRLLRRRGADQPFEAAVTRSTTLSLVGSVGAAVVALLLLADQLAPEGLGTGAFLSGAYATRWGLREAGLVALGVAAWCTRSGRSPQIARTLFTTGAAATCAGVALLGHAGAGPHLQLTRVVATAAHVAAATSWAGALVVLALTVALPRWRGSASTVDLRGALRAFGLPAAACVSVMVVTGVLLSSHVVGSVDAALRTFYGRTLLTKLALAGLAGALALANHRHVRGRRDLDLPRRTVLTETVVAVGIVAATAVLTSSQPATEPQLVQHPAVATRGPVNGPAADLQEAVSLRPNRPGRTLVVVDVFDTRRPAPAPITGVDVAVGQSPSVAANALSDGHWTAPASDVAPGATSLTVTVHRPGLPDVVSRRPWTVADRPDATLPAVVSTGPVGSVLRTVAAGLAGLVMLWWSAGAVWRRRRRQPVAVPAFGPGVLLRPDDTPHPSYSSHPDPQGSGAPPTREVD